MKTTHSNAYSEGRYIAVCRQNGFELTPPMRVKDNRTGETKYFPLREGDDGKGRYIVAHFDTEDVTTTDEAPDAA